MGSIHDRTGMSDLQITVTEAFEVPPDMGKIWF
jgi:hypothetical protein